MPRPPAPLPPSPGSRDSSGPRTWQRRSSALSRYALLVYALIVIDASLFPFGGWRDLGLSPYAYLSADWPRRALPFDLFVNALGYLPLGFVGGLALHPRLRGASMVAVSTLGCVLLSVHLEALQTYLPARVASTSDVLANGVGALLGAIAAARLAHTLLDTSRLRVGRTRWFAGDASRGLVLIGVWFGALVYPDAFVFGMGGLLKAFDPSRSQALSLLAGFGDGGSEATTAIRFQLAEAVVTALMLTGAGLLLQHLFRPGSGWAARFSGTACFVVATVATSTVTHAFLVEPPTGWLVLTPGARDGIVFAIAVLALATPLPATTRRALALAALAGALVLVNVFPDNPYASAAGLASTRGKLMNFYGLASGINLVWPYLAIAYLLRRAGRTRRSARSRSMRGASL